MNSALEPSTGFTKRKTMNWFRTNLWSLPCFCLIAHAGDPYALDLALGSDKKQVQLPVPTNGIVRLAIVKLEIGRAHV